jgi:hypothetical protein
VIYDDLNPNLIDSLRKHPLVLSRAGRAILTCRITNTSPA